MHKCHVHISILFFSEHEELQDIRRNPHHFAPWAGRMQVSLPRLFLTIINSLAPDRY